MLWLAGVLYYEALLLNFLPHVSELARHSVRPYAAHGGVLDYEALAFDFSPHLGLGESLSALIKVLFDFLLHLRLG